MYKTVAHRYPGWLSRAACSVGNKYSTLTLLNTFNYLQGSLWNMKSAFLMAMSQPKSIKYTHNIIILCTSVYFRVTEHSLRYKNNLEFEVYVC